MGFARTRRSEDEAGASVREAAPRRLLRRPQGLPLYGRDRGLGEGVETREPEVAVGGRVDELIRMAQEAEDVRAHAHAIRPVAR